MNSIVKALKEMEVSAGASSRWNLETLCKMAALEIETKSARVDKLAAENARLTAANESMQEDAVQNTYAFELMLKANKEQAEEIARLAEKVRYAYVQIEALEAK